MATNNMHIKFEIEIPQQTRVTLQKPCQLQSPDNEKSNMATRWPFWKWHCWKSQGFFPYTQVICYWSLDLIFKAKLKLESGYRKIQYHPQADILNVTYLKTDRLWAHGHKQHAHQIWNLHSKANSTYDPETMPTTESRCWNIQYGHQVAILKVTLVKINRLLPIHTRDVPVKFGVDIQSQTKVRVRKLKNPIWPPGGHVASDITENQ